jgi:hypothetical protein
MGYAGSPAEPSVLGMHTSLFQGVGELPIDWNYGADTMFDNSWSVQGTAFDYLIQPPQVHDSGVGPLFNSGDTMVPGYNWQGWETDAGLLYPAIQDGNDFYSDGDINTYINTHWTI